MWKFRKSGIDCSKPENVVKYYLLGKGPHFRLWIQGLMSFCFHWNIINIKNRLPEGWGSEK